MQRFALLHCALISVSVGACFADPPTPLDLAGDGSMLLVHGSVFEMGSNDFEADETPTRTVSVDEFYMDREEVTVGDYAQCVDDGECRAPRTGPSFNYGIAGRDEHPVNGVAWADAELYCAWAGGGTKRLPTEAEWELAAKGVMGQRYPWGDLPDPNCDYTVMTQSGGGCGAGTTMPVGSKPLDVSPHGILDMGGSVSEWVSDWYGEYNEFDIRDPVGASAGERRSIRGGSWVAHRAENFRTTRRDSLVPDATLANVGFRCVSKVLP